VTATTIEAVLWRRVNQATISTLQGESPGQYDIRLGSTADFDGFFAGLARNNDTPLGGFDLQVPLHAFEGREPVSQETLTIRYMGAGAARKNDWYIPSQRPTTAYALWRQGRGLKAGYTYSDATSPFLYILRDTAGEFHARWIELDQLPQLPQGFSEILGSADVGVHFFNTPALSDKAQRVYDALLRHYNVLLYGPPGTGKTHIMQEIAGQFVRDNYAVDTEEEVAAIKSTSASAMAEWTTFHQSYSYEEFVVGLKTNPDSKRLLDLVPVPGPLLELAEHARRSGNSSLLLIDEINRGNVSRIFGEFITLLEPDKRLDDEGRLTPTSVAVRLPYVVKSSKLAVSIDGVELLVESPFTLPRRVYTLASMNSVDKSVAPLDAALRRRFYTFALNPDFREFAAVSGIEGTRGEGASEGMASPADAVRLGVEVLRVLNSGISHFLGGEFQMGQWYLAQLAGTLESVEAAEAALVEIWGSRIFPHLKEMFLSRPEQLRAILSDACDAAGSASPMEFVEPPDHLARVGAMPFLLEKDISPQQCINFLVKLVATSEGAPNR